MKKTFTELKVFENVAVEYLLKNEYLKDNAWTEKQPTKLVSNIKSVFKQLPKIFEDFNSQVEDFKDLNCLVAENGAMLKDENGKHLFSSKGSIELRKSIKDLLETETEISQRIIEGDFDLNEIENEAFKGIVI